MELGEGEAPHEPEVRERYSVLPQTADHIEHEVDGLHGRVIDCGVGIAHRDVIYAVHHEVERLVARVQQPSEARRGQ